MGMILKTEQKRQWFLWSGIVPSHADWNLYDEQNSTEHEIFLIPKAVGITSAEWVIRCNLQKISKFLEDSVLVTVDLVA